MSSMKNLLGDMDFEEFEVKCKEVLSELKSMNWEQEQSYNDDARKLYNYWLEVGGRELIRKWVTDRGGYILESEVEECMAFMYDNWVGWLESFV